MAWGVILPAREPDAVARQPENIRRAAQVVGRGPFTICHSGASMGNLRPVSAAVQVRVLADFFTHAHVANAPAVDSDTLRQAVAARTPDERTQTGELDR